MKKIITIKHLTASVLFLSSLVVFAPAGATVIFDNGTNITNLGGSCSGCDNQYTMHDDFSLASDYTINSVTFDAAFQAPETIADFDVTATFYSSLQGSCHFKSDRKCWWLVCDVCAK